ncbi:MAG: hypothetical protein J7M39_06550, partial [Anaerolineae bacterium]|nr:hypothetical protein [Anaerolineae bacterium]
MLTPRKRSLTVSGHTLAKRLIQTVGYPRIGKEREVKRALEGYWKGAVAAEALMDTFWT